VTDHRQFQDLQQGYQCREDAMECWDHHPSASWSPVKQYASICLTFVCCLFVYCHVELTIITNFTLKLNQYSDSVIKNLFMLVDNSSNYKCKVCFAQPNFVLLREHTMSLITIYKRSAYEIKRSTYFKFVFHSEFYSTIVCK